MFLRVTTGKVSFMWDLMESVKTIRLGILIKVYDSLKIYCDIHKLIKCKDSDKKHVIFFYNIMLAIVKSSLG